jgi:2'-5' RNA ligase
MDASSGAVRSFIAIELPASLRALLATVQQELSVSLGDAAGAIKWVRSDGSHLTLQFLGDVRPEQIGAIQQGIERACAEVAPLTLDVGGLGVFPNVRRPRVIWVGLGGDAPNMERLAGLQQAVASQMESLGFKPDHNFKPHLTLGRVRDTASRSDLAAITEVMQYPQEQPLFENTFHVRSVSLMRSELQPGGAVHTELARFDLMGSE